MRIFLIQGLNHWNFEMVRNDIFFGWATYYETEGFNNDFDLEFENFHEYLLIATGNFIF